MPETLSRYRQIAARRLPAWMFAILVVWWMVSLVSYYQENEDTSDLGTSANRLTEISWATATELEDDPLWLQYLLLMDSSAGTKEECVDYFEELREDDLLDGRGEQSLRLMKSLVAGNPAPPGEIILNRWKNESNEAEIRAWEVDTMRHHFADAPPAWVTTAIKKEEAQQKTIFQLGIVSLAVWVAAFIVGLPFIPDALACFKTASHQAPSPITRCWHPIWILGLVLLVINAGDWFFGIAYFLIPMPETWMGSAFEDILFDGIWRFIGPVLLTTFAFVNWRHGGRILKLHKPPQWRPILGMLPIVAIYDLLLWQCFAWTGLTDHSGGVYLDEDGMTGLIYSIASGVIFAPIAEEIVFRGFLFQSLERRSGFWPATLLSTFLFAMIHFYGFHGTLSVASFGIVACVLYRATGSLWTPIIYHAVTNGIITASSWPLYNGLYSEF